MVRTFKEKYRGFKCISHRELSYMVKIRIGLPKRVTLEQRPDKGAGMASQRTNSGKHVLGRKNR